jgi:hypothetical protein
MTPEKDAAEPRPAPLDHGVRGDTNLFGFIVTVNYPSTELSPDVQGLLEHEIPDVIRDSRSTITHEGIHFLHAAMSSFMYRNAARLWSELQRCVKLAKQFPVGDPITLRSAAERFNLIFAEFDRESRALRTDQIAGLSPRHIIEGAAVYLADRMHVPDIRHSDFLHRLATTYGDGRSHYADAYRLGAHFLGESLFEIFSPLCLLSLCTSKPANTFCRGILAIQKSGILRTNHRPSAQEIGAIAVEHGIKGIRTAPQELKDGVEHPILGPYILEYLAQPEDVPFLEFAARPYERDLSTLTKFFTPPLFRFSDGVAIVNPHLPDLLRLEKPLSDEDRRRKNIQFLFAFTTISGAVLRMALPEQYDYYMQCPHNACPYYELRLCHSYPPIPTDYTRCTFPEWFSDVFQRNPDRVTLGE